MPLTPEHSGVPLQNLPPQKLPFRDAAQDEMLLPYTIRWIPKQKLFRGSGGHENKPRRLHQSPQLIAVFVCSSKITWAPFRRVVVGGALGTGASLCPRNCARSFPVAHRAANGRGGLLGTYTIYIVTYRCQNTRPAVLNSYVTN